MKISGVDIRPGNILEYEKGLWKVAEIQHTQPGKGGAFNQVELKNILDGRKLNERFRASETVEKVRLEQKDFQYLYAEGDMLVFMDTTTYEQLELQAEFVGERKAFLQDGMQVKLELWEEKPISVELPAQIEAEIVEADAVVIAGQAASHCVKSSIDDLLAEIVATDPALARKVYIMTDCMSSVTVPDGSGGFVADFTPEAEAALQRFADAGMHLVRSTDALAGWQGLHL